MSEMDANDFLMTTGIKSAVFSAVGDSVVGLIVRQPEVQHQRDFTTGEPKYWNDGKPRLQLKVVLQTEERDPEDADDTGERAVYVKGQMQQAVSQAVRKAKAPGLEVGGKLLIKHSAVGTASARGLNPPKLYEARYRAPEAAPVPVPEAAHSEAPATPRPATPAERMAQGEPPVKDVPADEIPF